MAPRMAQARTQAQQRQAALRLGRSTTTARSRPGSTARSGRPCIPIRTRRYEELSEFIHDLRHPNRDLLDYNAAPLIERNPLLFWKGLSAVLAAAVLLLLALQFGRFH